MNRRTIHHSPARRALILGVAGSWLLHGCGGGGAGAGASDPTPSGPSVVVHMNEIALALVRSSGLASPAVARALAVANSAAFDAYAAYHPVAVGTRWADASERRPADEHSDANRSRAIAYAMHAALADLFPTQRAALDAAFGGLGYALPDGASPTGSTAEHVGRRAAAAVVVYRHADGANQLGDLGTGGLAYADYTGYTPLNAPDLVNDPNRWQPLRYADAAGATVTQKFALPHWNRVVPFALPSASVLRPSAPARYGSALYRDQADEVIAISAALDDRQKAIAEYWADGPSSELSPGHWNLFCQFVCRRDSAGLESDLRLFFALSNAMLDAGIAAWDAKIAYDSVRPLTAVHVLHAGQTLVAPGSAGARTVAGEAWMPYQPATFPTPPFAEHVSGHSTFSAAAAEVLRLGSGRDSFGHGVTIAVGSSKAELGVAPLAPVSLGWSTFSAAAAEAGQSRLYGGIHFAAANQAGLSLGRAIGGLAWERAQRYWNGQG
jgi:hypothetical protein